MTHFRYYTLPRVRRALSILLLCLGLFSAWVGPGYPSSLLRRRVWASEPGTLCDGQHHPGLRFHPIPGNQGRLCPEKYLVVCRPPGEHRAILYPPKAGRIPVTAGIQPALLAAGPIPAGSAHLLQSVRLPPRPWPWLRGHPGGDLYRPQCGAGRSSVDLSGRR